MTKQETELHEKFLRGITLKMIIWGMFLVGSAVSSFWAGVYKIVESNDKTNQKIDRVNSNLTKRQDSVSYINELEHKDIWSAIDSKASKGKAHFVTESYSNGRNGNPQTNPVN